MGEVEGLDGSSGRLPGAVYPIDEDGNVLGAALASWEIPDTDTVRLMLLPGAGVGIVVSGGETKPAEGTCPEPGGCSSCPAPAWCRRLRLRLGITTLGEEPRADG